MKSMAGARIWISAMLDFRYDIRPEVRQWRRHRMVRIQFVDHLRDIVDGVPDARVGVAFIQLVANEPEQQGWVIFVLEDFVTDHRQLRGNGVGIVVVEAVTLGRHGQSKRNRDAVRVRRIQQLPVSWSSLFVVQVRIELPPCPANRSISSLPMPAPFTT
jgi:hypothetical protein